MVGVNRFNRLDSIAFIAQYLQISSNERIAFLVIQGTSGG